MNRPVAILISDVHYSLTTLELADNAMRQAIAKANELKVPLIVAGDLHDTKANLRAECTNRMIETFDLLTQNAYILVGNHDKINEKSDTNALNFLYKNSRDANDNYYNGGTEAEPGRDIIASSRFTNDIAINGMSLQFIPYQHNPDELRKRLKKIDKGSTIICHQGLEGSNSGEYIQDKSAINYQDVAGMRIISGHYHTRQTIALPKMGKWDYIGNPYTLNYGEANDPPKGYQILMSDGSLEFVSTNLRRHIIFEYIQDDVARPVPTPNQEDLYWVKAKGSREFLSACTKRFISRILRLDIDFKLTLEPTDLNITALSKTLTSSELLDSLIDSIDNTPETKDRLKSTWKSLCES